MNNDVPPDAKLLKCPSCGAPISTKPGQIVAKCAYCGSRVTVGTSSHSPSPQTTMIIETRHRHIGPHRLRRLLESAKVASKDAGNSTEGEGSVG